MIKFGDALDMQDVYEAGRRGISRKYRIKGHISDMRCHKMADGGKYHFFWKDSGESSGIERNLVLTRKKIEELIGIDNYLAIGIL